MSLSDAQKARAEASFKRKEDQARDGAKAWAEYEAKSRAVAKNMERLRALRLAKQSAKSDAAKDRGATRRSQPKRGAPHRTRRTYAYPRFPTLQNIGVKFLSEMVNGRCAMPPFMLLSVNLFDS